MKLLLIFSSCWFASVAAAVEPALTQEWLQKNYFESIRAENDRLILHFRATGERFYSTGGGRPGKVNDYGETVSILAGDSFTLNSRHASLQFSPLPKPIEKAGFLVTSRFNANSFGGGEQVRYAIVLLPRKNGSSELKFIAPEEGFDPAMPPNDPTFQKLLKVIGADH